MNALGQLRGEIRRGRVEQDARDDETEQDADRLADRNLAGISVLTLRFQLLYRPYDLSVQVFRRCWSTGFPAAPGGAGFASGGQATPGDTLFPNGSADTFPCAPASSSKFAPRCTRTILPATAAPRSSAACRQTAAASDGSPPAAASSSGRALSNGRRSSPTADASWSATSCQSAPVAPVAARGCRGYRRSD